MSAAAVWLPAAVPVEVKYCRDCRELNGSNAPAERILPGGTRLCDFHWRKRAGMRPLTSAPPQLKVPAVHQEEKKMPRASAIDWDAVQRDRDLGMPVSEICEKYKVSNPTVYTRTHGGGANASGINNAQKRAAVVKKNLPPKTSVETGAISSALQELRARRDQLNELIASLEKYAEK